MKTTSDPFEIQKKMADMFKNKKPLLIWDVSSQGVIRRIPVRLKSYNRDFEVLIFSLGDEEKAAYESFFLSKSTLKIYDESIGIIFTVNTKHYDQKSAQLSAEVPKGLTFVERRKDRRVLPDHKIYIDIKKDKKIVRKQVFDFNSKGISFVFSRQEYSKFEEEDKGIELIFSWGGKSFPMAATVAGVHKLDPHKSEHLPFAYKKIAFLIDFPDDEESIYHRIYQTLLQE